MSQEAADAGIAFAMKTLEQVPKDNQEAMEAYMTGVLIVFWSALWGAFGTEYAKGFIESQLQGMQAEVPNETYTMSRVQ